MKRGAPLGPLLDRTDPSTRNELGQKLCKRCRVWKNETDFGVQRKARDLLSTYCKECKRLETGRARFGEIWDKREEILASQGGACLGCHTLVPVGGWKIDHDHSCCPGNFSCGRCVRGMLCGSCNTSLGYAYDDSSILRSLADYIDNWRKDA